MKLTGMGKWKTWLLEQKKAIRRKMSVFAFFAAEEMNRGLFFLMMFLFVPYIITVMTQEDIGAGKLENRLLKVKDCPQISYQTEHGSVSIPIEIYLKGVMGGYLYTQDFETRCRHRQEGELILYEGKRTESGNGLLLGSEVNLNDLAIRLRTNLYVDYLESLKEADTAKDGHGKADAAMTEAFFAEKELYCTEEELAYLFGSRWNEVEKQIDDCLQSTTGLVYGVKKCAVRVSCQEKLTQEGLEIYVAW